MSPAPGFDLSREAYRGISLYAPNRAPCAIDLSDNTNLWGAPPSAVAALRQAAMSAFTRYPSLYAGDLKQALADYLGVQAECIVTGCGSDDVLDSAFRAFAEPGDRVVFPDPSFMMVPLFGRMNALDPIAVRLGDDLDIDADAMLSARGRLTYVCSPNNPTGTVASRSAIQRVLDQARGVVILDEAYAEFSNHSFAAEATTRGNTLVVRTMSKAFGLAGLRVGYAVGHPRLVAEVEKSRGPYKVNAVAEAAAIAALTRDMGWVRDRVGEVIENRYRLTNALAVLGPFDVLPSGANFVLAVIRPGAGVRAAVIAAQLRAQGIAIRPFTDLPGIGDAIRITVGPWEMMQEALAALERILAEVPRS